jgi:hypothetical protein
MIPKKMRLVVVNNTFFLPKYSAHTEKRAYPDIAAKNNKEVRKVMS